MIIVDPHVERHLVAAVAAHCRRLRLEGVAVPAALTELVMAFRVRTGQDGSDFDAASDDRDGAGMALTLDFREAGELLGGLSESTVKRLVRDGELDAVHIGRSARIRADDLRQYVADLPTTRESNDD